MNTKEMGDLIVRYMQEGRELQLLDMIYAPDVVSVERFDIGIGQEFRGVEDVRRKKLWIMEHFPLKAVSMHGPFLHGEDRFAIMYFANAEDAMTAQVEAFSVIGTYEVANGKIVREEFYM